MTAWLFRVEEGVLVHLRIPQHAVEDFEGRHGLLAVVGEPGLRFQQFRRNLLGHPAVALAQQTDEVGPAMLDFRQAQGQHLAFGLGFVGNAPAQVHLAPSDAPVLAEAAELREDLLDEFLAFLLHIAEGGGDENADFTLASLGGGRHGCPSIVANDADGVKRSGGQAAPHRLPHHWLHA